MSASILVVEDSSDLAFGLQRNLEFQGYEVEVVEDGRRGLERALAGGHALIILDLMLPELEGLELLDRIRTSKVETPVLILTAKGEELDKVRGLRAGADDYLTKPFGLMELMARVEALLRRSRDPHASRAMVFSFGDVEVDLGSRAVRKGVATVSLAPREFGLLVALLRARGQARSRQDLLKEVWGHKAEVSTRTVDTHIGELRKKLENDPSRPVHIVTVRKFGYRLDPDGVVA